MAETNCSGKGLTNEKSRMMLEGWEWGRRKEAGEEGGRGLG